jgi:hypothetical protein
MLINVFGRNVHWLRTHTNGFSHEDSLLQPAPIGNCANWLIGHIATYRNRILAQLGQEPTLPAEWMPRYDMGSAPVLPDDTNIAPFAMLLDAALSAQPRIEVGLRALTPERAATMTQFATGIIPIAESVLMLMRHEAMHVGQLELLAEVKKGAQL